MRSLAASCLPLLLCVIFVANASAEPQRGIAATKPAEGPYVETEHGFMVPYEETIPGAGVTFRMIPVPGGEVTLGPRDAENAPEHHSPQRTVKLPPFWMAECEVRWAEFHPYMSLYGTFSELAFLRGQLYDGSPKLEKKLGERPALQAAVDAMPSQVDGVTAPTALYDPETTYWSGSDEQLPAVSMTVYSARQYTKWLSTLTGVSYRLPSEAEWEHAARAGQEGDAPTQALDEVAWYEANSDYLAQKVGGKAANAWGLHDMIGNVAEWVLDVPAEAAADTPVMNGEDAIAAPKAVEPRIAKGGYYESEPDGATFAARLLSVEEDWKASDPNLPLSPWWFADDPAMGVGFRLVRPLGPMSDEMKQLAWEIDSPDLKKSVEQRVRGGRGKLQTIDSEFPEVVKQLADPDVRALME